MQEMKELEKQNNQYLALFQNYLANQNLKKQTIRNHYLNVDVFLDYLCFRNAARMQEFEKYVDDFFGHFYIRKCIWASAQNLKATITSLKKFFKCMVEYGHITNESYETFVQDVKDKKDYWLDRLNEYLNNVEEY